MGDPKVDRGSLFDGSIRVDSNRYKSLNEWPQWCQMIVLPKRGLKQNAQEALAWIYGSWGLGTIGGYLSLWVGPGVSALVYVVVLTLVGLVCFFSIRKPLDTLVVCIRIFLVAVGSYYLYPGVS